MWSGELKASLRIAAKKSIHKTSSSVKTQGGEAIWMASCVRQNYCNLLLSLYFSRELIANKDQLNVLHQGQRSSQLPTPVGEKASE